MMNLLERCCPSFTPLCAAVLAISHGAEAPLNYDFADETKASQKVVTEVGAAAFLAPDEELYNVSSSEAVRA